MATSQMFIQLFKETTKKIFNSILTIYCHKGRNILKQFSYASYILPE